MKTTVIERKLNELAVAIGDTRDEVDKILEEAEILGDWGIGEDAEMTETLNALKSARKHLGNAFSCLNMITDDPDENSEEEIEDEDEPPMRKKVAYRKDVLAKKKAKTTKPGKKGEKK